MFLSVVALDFSGQLDLFNLRCLSDLEKDPEILILRHQLDILERKQTHSIRPSIAEKLTLAVLTDKLKTMSNQSASQLRNVLRIFQPDTVLKWHRELVRRNWTQEHKNKDGRPRIDHLLIMNQAQFQPKTTR